MIKKPKLILQILNLLNGILLSVYLVKIMGWSTTFNPVKLIHIIIGAFIVFGIKSWIEVKTNTKDPIKSNKYVNGVFFVGSGMFILGVAFKLMYWPAQDILLVLGVFITCSSFVLSFFAPDSEKAENEDIIDDF